MATLVFSALGTMIGGPLGGAIGALVGRQVDSAIFGSPSREGPRLKELTASTSSYGAVLPRHFGQMRVGGAIIWATDLVEHRDTQGGGKGRPSVTSYSYSASFAVALSSRPLLGIGRIWADGNLLRGSAGDLKTGGTLRFYSGRGDQAADPLMEAAEVPTPAYRGRAYVVFEDLHLENFGNRIPALTFEIFADEGPISIQEVVQGVFDDVSSDIALPGIAGLTQESALADTLDQLQSVAPLYYEVNADGLHVMGEGGGTVHVLSEATASTKSDGFGKKTGFALKRAGVHEVSPRTLRYYDIGRDYQPGVQNASGAAPAGQPGIIELPMALDSTSARHLIEGASRRIDWSRETLMWRSSELDPACRPGALVTVPDLAGVWRVMTWEWGTGGIELSLTRTPFANAPPALSVNGDTGRASIAADREIGTTWLSALELPWDGSGAGDRPMWRGAVSSASAGWAGAALYFDEGDGQLVSAGSSGRARATVGYCDNALGAASPLIVDRRNSVTIQLAGTDMLLPDATMRQLAMGGNRALVGREIIQFCRATPIGGGQWRLDQLLRGRGGTEPAVASHAAGETFILLDDSLVPLDGGTAMHSPVTRIAAIGAGDAGPVTSEISCRGLSQKPLFPVHPRLKRLSDGGLVLNWVRRARAAWFWRDQVDTPLHEQSETYEVLLGQEGDPAAIWVTSEPTLTISAAVVADLAARHPGLDLCVRQRGSYASSTPLLLAPLNS